MTNASSSPTNLSLSSWLQHKIIPYEGLVEWRQQIQQQQLTVASINGSFDLMHSGHLHILFEASKQADILIVGLNSDRSIREYKSPKRPIILLEDRLAMMASIAFINYVSFFDETTPNHWLEKVQPHVHVNGAEYGLNCIEAATVQKLGARLHLVERIDGLSTSSLIEKIKAL